jgi:hypothetical protein
MCPLCNRLCAIIPVLAVAVGAVALAGGSVTGGGDAPDRSLTNLPPAAGAVAPAPEGLSSAATTRDWQEVAGSFDQPRSRR